MWRAPVPFTLPRVINENGRRCDGGIYADRAAGSVLWRRERAGAGCPYNGFPRRVPGVATNPASLRRDTTVQRAVGLR